MRPDRTSRRPGAYLIRVDDHLDGHWAPWSGHLTLTRSQDGTTSISGVVTDQAELHGRLDKLRDLNVTLLSVETVVVTPGA